MTNEEREEVQQLIRDEFQEFLGSDRYIFTKTIQYLDGRNLQVGKGTGTKIGTETTQKIGFWNKTPIVQPANITTPSGGLTVDTEARTAITSIITVLRNVGLIAS